MMVGCIVEWYKYCNRKKFQLYRITIDDYIGPLDVEIPDTLYEVVGEFRNGRIVPVFKFKEQ